MLWIGSSQIVNLEAAARRRARRPVFRVVGVVIEWIGDRKPRAGEGVWGCFSVVITSVEMLVLVAPYSRGYIGHVMAHLCFDKSVVCFALFRNRS